MRTMLKLRPENQRKYLFIALGILLIIGLVYRFFPVLQGMMSPDQEIEIKEKSLIKFRKMVADGKDLDKRLNSLDQTLKQLESRLFSGKTPSLAAVEIQKILHDIAGKSNVQIRSMKVLKPGEVKQSHYLSVPVEFYMLPTIRQLKEILYQIGICPKYLAIKKVTTRYHASKEREFRCRLTVAGYMRKTEK